MKCYFAAGKCDRYDTVNKFQMECNLQISNWNRYLPNEVNKSFQWKIHGCFEKNIKTSFALKIDGKKWNVMTHKHTDKKNRPSIDFDEFASQRFQKYYGDKASTMCNNIDFSFGQKMRVEFSFYDVLFLVAHRQCVVSNNNF